MKFFNKQDLKIALIILVIIFLWIMYSDKILLSLFNNFEKLTQKQYYKGWFYVFTASVIIYLLVKREIGKKQLSVEKLNIEQSKYKSLFERANDAIFILDDQNCFVDCNDQTLVFFQCTREQLIGKSLSDVSPEYQIKYIKSYDLFLQKAELIKNGKPQKFEWIYTFLGSDKKFYSEVSINQIRIANEDCILAIVRDISESKFVEKELKKKNEELLEKYKELQKLEEEKRVANDKLVFTLNILKENNDNLIIAKEKIEESEEKFRELFEKSNDAVLIIENGRFTDCNQATIDLLSYSSKHEFLNVHPSKLSPQIQPDGRMSMEKAKEMMNIALKNGTHRFEWIHTKKNGEIFPVEVLLTTIVNTPDKKNIHTVWRDITERKKTEDILLESEERFRTYYKNMPTPTYTWQQKDDDFILVEYNTAAEIITNGSVKNIFNKKLSGIHKNNPEIIEDINICFKSKKLIRREIPYTFGTGEKKIFDVSYVFVSPNNVIHHTNDITERRIAEIALKVSEEKYRMLVENGPSVFWITNKNGKIVYISPNVKKVNGFTSNEIYEKGSEVWFDRIHKEDIENVLTNFNLIFTENKQFDVTYRIQNKKGKWIWLHDVGEKYINDDGIELAYGVLTNITLKKQIDQKVLNAMINAEERERSRIAKDLHDGVSPVLSAIKLYIQSMNDSQDDEIRSELSEKINITIGEAIKSIKEISNNISPHILQNFGLTMAVEAFINKFLGLKHLNILVNSEIKERIPIDIETAFYRITSELINNTFKYAKAKTISINYLVHESNVIMKYTDDGIGFNVNQVRKNKIGMGIFNMKNRISALHGQFNVESEIGKGINVDISVPLNI